MHEIYASWNNEKKVGPISKQDDLGKVKSMHLQEDPIDGTILQ